MVMACPQFHHIYPLTPCVYKGVIFVHLPLLSNSRSADVIRTLTQTKEGHDIEKQASMLCPNHNHC